jgi:hypothetical protein
MIADLYERVKLFNEIAGQPQKFDTQSEEFWIWVDNQVKLIEEEVKETRAAVDARDLLETLDGTLDVFVTNAGLMDILECGKVSVLPAGYAVCTNNLSKMTQSPSLARKTVAEYDAQLIPCYSERSVIMDGKYPREWFTVRRVEDNKIMKPLGYVRVDISRFIPETQVKRGLKTYDFIMPVGGPISDNS